MVRAEQPTPPDAPRTAARRRPPGAGLGGHQGVLYPAIAEAAHRAGADAVGLIDIGCRAALNLTVDLVGISYSDGRALGDPSSPVQLSVTVARKRSVPARPMPAVVARVGIDRTPIDVTDPDDARWLRSSLPADQPDRAARLAAEIGLAQTTPPVLWDGDALELLPEAIARVPADAMPVVITTWALSRYPLDRRLRFLRRLDEAAPADRTVAWVSAEGVGVAPAISTLGDRRASGHSIIGLALLRRSELRAEAVGRCWSQGRFIEWLAEA